MRFKTWHIALNAIGLAVLVTGCGGDEESVPTLSDPINVVPPPQTPPPPVCWMSR